MPATDYLKFHNSQSGVTDWPVNQIRFYSYGSNLTPDQALAQFLGLSPEQKLAQTRTSEPAADAGYQWSAIINTGSGFDTSYSFSLVGTDFGGHAIVSTPAPILIDIVQQAPRRRGDSYTFAGQSALNVFLSRRHPQHDAPFWVVYAGPGFADQYERDAVLRTGYNAIAENVPNRGLFRRDRIAPLVPGGYDLCKAIADSLSVNDARRPWLLEWWNAGVDGDNRTKHYLIDNRDAAQAMGRLAYQDYQNGDWTNGNPLFGITPNFEVYTASPRSGNDAETQWRNMDGYFMEGVRLAFLDDLAQKNDGRQLPALIMYDWTSICHYSIALKSRDQNASGVYGDLEPAVNYDPEIGIPFYFSYAALGANFSGGSKAAPLAANNPYSQYLKTYGGYAGSGEYMRNTYPETETYWQKNPDGSLKTRVVNGVTLLVPRGDAFRTTINGEVCDILGQGFYSISEGANFLYLAHERRQQAMVDTVVRAGGKHLPKSTDRQAGWEKLKLVQWARFEAEFKQENELTKPDGSGDAINPATGAGYLRDPLNHRPLPGFFIIGDIMQAFFYGRDMYRFWMEPQPELSAQGAANANSHSRAAHEFAQVATNRLAKYKWIRENTFQYIIPQLLIRNLGRDRSWYDPNEEFEKKIDFVGGLCDSRADRGGKPYFFFGSQYLAQEATGFTDVIYWWVDGAGNPITPGYFYRLNGREMVADQHEVPAACIGLPPSRFRRRFIDMTSELHTHTGSYLDAKITNHPTPPSIAS